MDMTLSIAAGVALSLVFSYIPQARERFQALDGTHKRLVLLAFMAVIAFVQFAAAGVYTWQAGIDALTAFAVVAIANQTTYQLTPQTAQPRQDPPQ